MGVAALDADPNLARIRLTLPNRHHLPFDVSGSGSTMVGAACSTPRLSRMG